MIKFAPTQLDGYKTGHPRQYPENIRLVCSNFTPRGSRILGVEDVTFLGLQYFLKEYLIKNWNETFFSQPIDAVCKKYMRTLNAYLGPDHGNSEKIIRDLHKLGYLPLEFWALPEGSSVPLRTPMFVVYNTCPEELPDAAFGWITNMIETILSTTLWMPCTSATTALQYRKLLTEWAMKTNPEMAAFVPWQGHDFSYRGHSSHESAILSAAGHLLSFTGTDTVPSLDFMEEFYNADIDKELVGGSVSATEHSTMCCASTYDASGKPDDFAAIERMIFTVHPTGIVSIVCDTFDYWNVIDTEDGILVRLKDRIMARAGKVVIRPDSGDPVKIVTGYMVEEIDVDDNGEYFERSTGLPLTPNEVKGSVQCLWDIFGGTVSSTGYRQLDEHIGLIYGDSITLERALQICERLERKGFASTNLVYGIGSYTYQYVTRDTFGFAVKSTYCEKVDDEGKLYSQEIFKDPKTDNGLKKSAKGLIAVYKDGNTFRMKDQATWSEVHNCAFVKVFSNGILTKDWTLAEVRAEVEKNL